MSPKTREKHSTRVRQVFWRILLFYVFAILIISLIIRTPTRACRVTMSKTSASAPFTLVFEHAGLLSAAAVMNAVILTAVLSAGIPGCTRHRICTPWRPTAKRRVFS
ncbi:hypothetical protein ACNKHS_13160 [Shigella flexneri]